MITPQPATSVPDLPPNRSRRMAARTALTLAICAVTASAALVGYRLGGGSSSHPSQVGISLPSAPDRASAPIPGSSTDSNSNATSGVNADAVAGTLDHSIVNISTTLSSGNAAAGTGIVISSTGLVLTNNHVIADSTSIRAEVAASGTTYSGTVLGYDQSHDVAVVQLRNATGLTPAPIASGSNVGVGDAVIALGNAGGRGGATSIATGSVTALDQPITASDQNGANAERLTHLIRINAPIQPGDSGGPLATADGRVVGINTAASQRGNTFGVADQGSTEGFAIPIHDALSIASQITAGRSVPGIHLGATRGVLGIEVAESSAADFGSTSAGAGVVGVASGSGAEAAGITTGAVITAINQTGINSASALTQALVPAKPGAVVSVTWLDAAGVPHHADVTLESAPPA